MGFKQKVLFISLIVVWGSIFLKCNHFKKILIYFNLDYVKNIFFLILDEGQSFLSKNAENENSDRSDSFRLRQTIRDAYHQVVDDSKEIDVKTSPPNSDSFRVRQTVRDAYHKVVDKNSDQSKSTPATSDSHIVRQTINDVINKVKPSTNDSSSYRIRQTIGDVIHRVVDDKSSENSSSFRIRQTISDSVHRVVDKPAESIKSNDNYLKLL